MRTLHKILVGIGIAGALILGVIWGERAASIQSSTNTVAEYIQKPGHLAFADVVFIQKPGH